MTKVVNVSKSLTVMSRDLPGVEGGRGQGPEKPRLSGEGICYDDQRRGVDSGEPAKREPWASHVSLGCTVRKIYPETMKEDR